MKFSLNISNLENFIQKLYIYNAKKSAKTLNSNIFNICTFCKKKKKSHSENSIWRNPNVTAGRVLHTADIYCFSSAVFTENGSTKRLLGTLHREKPQGGRTSEQGCISMRLIGCFQYNQGQRHDHHKVY